MKKVVSLILALSLIFAGMSVNVFAFDDTEPRPPSGIMQMN